MADPLLDNTAGRHEMFRREQASACTPFVPCFSLFRHLPFGLLLQCCKWILPPFVSPPFASSQI